MVRSGKGWISAYILLLLLILITFMHIPPIKNLRHPLLVRGERKREMRKKKWVTFAGGLWDFIRTPVVVVMQPFQPYPSFPIRRSWDSNISLTFATSSKARNNQVSGHLGLSSASTMVTSCHLSLFIQPILKLCLGYLWKKNVSCSLFETAGS